MIPSGLTFSVEGWESGRPRFGSFRQQIFFSELSLDVTIPANISEASGRSRPSATVRLPIVKGYSWGLFHVLTAQSDRPKVKKHFFRMPP